MATSTYTKVSPPSSLTTHDTFILSKIADPEASPSCTLLLDVSLSSDPHITDPETYARIVTTERELLSQIQAAELQFPPPSPDILLETYLTVISSLGELINNYPNYASARNNRAQALRRVYGDGVLLSSTSSPSQTSPIPGLISNPSNKTNSRTKLQDETGALDSSPSSSTLRSACYTILNDLDTAISLLSPSTPFSSAVHPVAARTLSQAYTQRGAIYHFTSKQLSKTATGSDAGTPSLAMVSKSLSISEGRPEQKWTSAWDFETAASRDFAAGGRYGNEVARGLAVSTNPTAKLCGDMVRSAMVREMQGMM